MQLKSKLKVCHRITVKFEFDILKFCWKWSIFKLDGIGLQISIIAVIIDVEFLFLNHSRKGDDDILFSTSPNSNISYHYICTTYSNICCKKLLFVCSIFTEETKKTIKVTPRPLKTFSMKSWLKPARRGLDKKLNII